MTVYGLSGCIMSARLVVGEVAHVRPAATNKTCWGPSMQYSLVDNDDVLGCRVTVNTLFALSSLAL